MTRPILIHLHIPKTAGSTLNDLLANAVTGKHFAYSDPGNPEILEAMPQDERDKIEFLFGHFPYGLHRLFSRPVQYIASVREPQRRVLSFFRYVLGREDHPKHALAKEAGNFNAFLKLARHDMRIRNETDNMQLRMLSGQMPVKDDYVAAMSRALENIRAENFLVLDSDDLQKALPLLMQRTQLRFGAIPRLNTSEGRRSFAEEVALLDAEAKETLEALTKWDAIIYAYVKEVRGNASETPPSVLTPRSATVKPITYISYGMPKSASTFTYVVTEHVLKMAGHTLVGLSAKAKGGASRLNYFDPISWPAIERAKSEIGSNSVVIKTHGAPDKHILQAVSSGEILASAVIRDPRDTALALMDHARRSRSKGLKGFSSIETIADAMTCLDGEYTRFIRWIEARKVLLHTYDEICFDTESAVQRIIDQIGAKISAAEVVATLPKADKIEQFNKGQRNRFESEMTLETQKMFLDHYKNIYQRYLQVDREKAAPARNQNVIGAAPVASATDATPAAPAGASSVESPAISSVVKPVTNTATPAIEVLFLQTAEKNYRPLLELSSQTAREYCARHEFNYESFFGIVRGYHPWHATFNRIPLLKRLLDTGYSGWVCYMDADAFVEDLDFDLRAYLSDKHDLGFIIAAGGNSSNWWNVNAGIFLVNLNHPVGQAIIRGWAHCFNEITDAQLQAAPVWSQVPNDQQLLWRVLQSIPDAERFTLVQQGDSRLVNGKFIRQILRAHGTMDARIAAMRRQVGKLLGERADLPAMAPRNGEDKTYQEFVQALYRVLLLREADPDGLAGAVKTLQAGESFEGAMRNCLNSSEFGKKKNQFIQAYLGATNA